MNGMRRHIVGLLTAVLLVLSEICAAAPVCADTAAGESLTASYLAGEEESAPATGETAEESSVEDDVDTDLEDGSSVETVSENTEDQTDGSTSSDSEEEADSGTNGKDEARTEADAQTDGSIDGEIDSNIISDTDEQSGSTEDDEAEDSIGTDSITYSAAAAGSGEIEFETYSDGDYTVVSVTAEQLTSNDPSTVIRKALSLAETGATEENPYKIVIEEGTYELRYILYVPDNTWLYAEGVTFVQYDGAEKSMIRIGTDGEEAVGYCYENIIIEGGTWDKNGNSKSLIVIGHAHNVTVRGAEFTNCTNAHLMEVAGVNGLTVTDCTFSDQLLETTASKKTYEAIQLDILEDSRMAGYRPEDLPLKNIVITNCAFDNVPRGIGMHSSVLNNPADTLTITGNSFKNIKSCAIQLMNVKNCTISDNTMEDLPRGIYVYSYQSFGCYYGTTLEEQGGITSDTSTVYQTPSASNIVISNNTISVSGNDPYASYTLSAVYISGKDYSTGYSPGSGDTLPDGNYYLTGVTVKNNTIVTATRGILLGDVRDSSVSGNSITGTGTGYNGITVNNQSMNDAFSSNTVSGGNNGVYIGQSSSSITVKANTIKKSAAAGIYFNNSTATNVTSNSIASVGKSGISLAGGSTVTNVTSNSISSAGESGISLAGGSTVKNMTSNSITSAGGSGISLTGGSTVTNVMTNSITSVGGIGITISGSTVKNIKENTISKPGSHGIELSSAALVTNVKENTITNGNGYGIQVAGIGRNLLISTNTISGCAKALIYCNPGTDECSISIKNNYLTGKNKKYQGIYATGAKVTVQANTIKKCSYAVQFTSTVTGTIYKNTMYSNSFNKYKVGSKTSGNLSKPALTIAAEAKNSITLSWKKISCTGYRVYRASKKSGTYKRVAAITKSSTVSCTNKGLQKKTGYYYKMRAYKKICSTTIYSNYSGVRYGKTSAK